MFNINKKIIVLSTILFFLVSFIVFVNARPEKKSGLAIVSEAYGSSPGSKNWNPHADINRDKVVDIQDLALASKSNTVTLETTTESIFTPLEAGPTIISVEPENTYVNLVENDFSIDVNVTDALETWAFEFKLSWDYSVLNITNTTNGSFLSQGGEAYCVQDVHYDEGWLRFGCTLLEPATSQLGSGNLAIIDFTTLNEGETSLHLYDTKLLNDTLDNYTHTAEDGYVLVDSTNPVVTIRSPKNGITYNNSSVALTFLVDEPTSWTGYNLDNQGNVTSGNTTLTGLSDGPHIVTVYARDIVGNEASATHAFSIDTSENPGYPGVGGQVPLFDMPSIL